MERLILKGITHPGAEELSEGLISIGRNPTNDIRLHEPTVSSFHCELLVSGSTVLVRDLQSTNGTFIDEEPVQESILRAWQVLRLGRAEMRLEVEEVGTEPVVRIPTVEQPPEEADTRLLDGRLGCHHHPGVPAIVRCTVCGLTYCEQCVRPIGLIGGAKRLFCPACASACEPLLPTDKTRKKPTILGRLTQTIRIRLRGDN